MSDQPHCLVSFDSVSARVDGRDISDILELKLSATANGAPSVTLVVDGAQNGASAASAPYGAAASASLGTVSGLFQDYRKMALAGHSTLSLSLVCRTDGSNGQDVQELSLNGWLLIDVALSPVQRRGVCALSLTFAHPIYGAHLGGAMAGLMSTLPRQEIITGGNPLEVLLSAIDAYSRVQRSFPPAPSGASDAVSAAAVWEKLRGHLDKAVAALRASVRWTGGGLPAATQLGGVQEALCRGIGEYARPSSVASLLQTVLSSFVPECSLALGGDYTQDQLVLGPFEPWAEASFTVDDSDIFSMDFPHADPNPLSGVKMGYGGAGGDTIDSFNYIGAQVGDGAKPFEVFYVPQSELAAPRLYGLIQQIAEPGWLQHVAGHSTNMSSAADSDTVSLDDGRFHCAANTPPDAPGVQVAGGLNPAPAVEYAAAALQCAKAYFETSYTKDWEFSVSMRLMFKSGGKVLCPGQVVSIQSADRPGAEVVGGYITGVEHVVSVPSRAATTRIACTHPRFGALPAAISSHKNALYA